jgi:hypothetical protein
VISDVEADAAGRESQEQAFHHEHAEQAQAVCAQCKAYGNFPAARRGTRKQQRGHIGASNAQHHAQGERQEEHGPIAQKFSGARSAHDGLERKHGAIGDQQVGLPAGVDGIQPPGDYGKFRLRRGSRNARSQSALQPEPRDAITGRVEAQIHERRGGVRNPGDVAVDARGRTCGGHSDHREALIVECEGAAENARIAAETIAPHLFGDDGRMHGRGGGAFVVAEEAPQQGPFGSVHGEEITGHQEYGSGRRPVVFKGDIRAEPTREIA